jgi:hypothetical protein
MRGDNFTMTGVLCLRREGHNVQETLDGELLDDGKTRSLGSVDHVGLVIETLEDNGQKPRNDAGLDLRKVLGVGHRLERLERRDPAERVIERSKDGDSEWGWVGRQAGREGGRRGHGADLQQQ